MKVIMNHKRYVLRVFTVDIKQVFAEGNKFIYLSSPDHKQTFVSLWKVKYTEPNRKRFEVMKLQTKNVNETSSNLAFNFCRIQFHNIPHVTFLRRT